MKLPITDKSESHLYIIMLSVALDYSYNVHGEIAQETVAVFFPCAPLFAQMILSSIKCTLHVGLYVTF